MNDWQDKESARETRIDERLKDISTEDLKKSLKRRIETEISEEVRAFEAKLRSQKEIK